MSRSLALDWSGKNSFEEGSLGSNSYVPMIRDRRARGLSPPPEIDRERDGGFESMSSQDNMAPDDKPPTSPLVEGQCQVQSNETNRMHPPVTIESSVSETSIFSRQQQQQQGFTVSSVSLYLCNIASLCWSIIYGYGWGSLKYKVLLKYLDWILVLDKADFSQGIVEIPLNYTRDSN